MNFESFLFGTTFESKNNSRLRGIEFHTISLTKTLVFVNCKNISLMLSTSQSIFIFYLSFFFFFFFDLSFLFFLVHDNCHLNRNLLQRMMNFYYRLNQWMMILFFSVLMFFLPVSIYIVCEIP